MPKKNKIFTLPFLVLITLLIILLVARILIGLMLPRQALVAGFPKLPSYPKAQLIYSQKVAKKSGREKFFGYSAAWESTDSVPVISKWFKNKLLGWGWSLDVRPADEDTQEIQNIIYKKGEQIVILSLITKKEKSLSEITIDYLPRPILEEEEEEEIIKAQ